MTIAELHDVTQNLKNMGLDEKKALVGRLVKLEDKAAFIGGALAVVFMDADARQPCLVPLEDVIMATEWLGADNALSVITGR